MSRPEDEMEDLRRICPGATEMTEAGTQYVLLPSMKHPTAGGNIDALLCPQQHGGYTTRLFLSEKIPQKGNNWSTHTILSRAWHTWSWNNVPADQRLAEILAQHMRAFR